MSCDVCSLDIYGICVGHLLGLKGRDQGFPGMREKDGKRGELSGRGWWHGTKKRRNVD